MPWIAYTVAREEDNVKRMQKGFGKSPCPGLSHYFHLPLFLSTNYQPFFLLFFAPSTHFGSANVGNRCLTSHLPDWSIKVNIAIKIPFRISSPGWSFRNSAKVSRRAPTGYLFISSLKPPPLPHPSLGSPINPSSTTVIYILRPSIPYILPNPHPLLSNI